MTEFNQLCRTSKTRKEVVNVTERKAGTTSGRIRTTLSGLGTGSRIIGWLCVGIFALGLIQFLMGGPSTGAFGLMFVSLVAGLILLGLNGIINLSLSDEVIVTGGSDANEDDPDDAGSFEARMEAIDRALGE